MQVFLLSAFPQMQLNLNALHVLKVLFVIIDLNTEILVLSFACMIRIFNSFGYAIESIYANEIYPTCVRALGTGMLLSVVIYINTIILQRASLDHSLLHTIALGKILQINPYILIGAVLLIAPFATLQLKETLG